MTNPIARDILARVRKLALLPEEARQCRFAVSITRLTVLKKLCQEPAVANRFVTYLAQKALERAKSKHRRSSSPPPQDQAHQQLMTEALAEMDGWPDAPSETSRRRLLELLSRMREEQNEHKRIPFGAVRMVHDWELLIVEKAADCLLTPRAAGNYAYEVARDYAERYDSGHGTGLTPESATPLQEIVDFWLQEFGLDSDSLRTPAKTQPPTAEQSSLPKAEKGSTSKREKIQFTARQGQFLAFIHLYHKLHRRGPGELDMVKYFRVTPPSVHGMIVKLEELGLVTRSPGVARSVRVAIPEEEIPSLEDVAGPSW